MHHTLSFLLSLPSSSLCWATCPLFPRISTTPKASWAETMSSPSLLYLRTWHCVAHKAPTKHIWSQKINENKPVSNLGSFHGNHCLVPKCDLCSFVSNTFTYAICHGTEETWWRSQGSGGESGWRQGHFPSTCAYCVYTYNYAACSQNHGLERDFSWRWCPFQLMVPFQVVIEIQIYRRSTIRQCPLPIVWASHTMPSTFNTPLSTQILIIDMWFIFHHGFLPGDLFSTTVFNSSHSEKWRRDSRKQMQKKDAFAIKCHCSKCGPSRLCQHLGTSGNANSGA